MLLLTQEDSVQFVTPILFRVIRVHDWPTYSGWVWLDGYQLDDSRQAIRRRSLFVRTGGLRRASATGTAACTGSPRSRRRSRVESGDPANPARGGADPLTL